MAMRMDTLKDRISKAEEKISKKQNTVTKKQGWIEKRRANIDNLTAQERRWEEIEIENLMEDVDRLEGEIKEAKASLEKYQAQLTAELEKAASRNVTVILEFLENWKRNVMEWYAGRFDRYLVALEEYYAKSREHADWFNHGGWRQENAKEIDKAYRAYEKDFRRKWNDIERYCIPQYNPETRQYVRAFDSNRLQKELDAEANAKYDDIIERTNAICGKITDARGLWIGNKGDLDGIIVGERGTAKVQTIGAGGYNIQCFHFRTLVHEFK